MPLDRRITVGIEERGSYVEGEYVPGPRTDYPVWATRIDKELTDITEQGGLAADVVRRQWRVRWFAELAAALSSQVFITDEFGDEYQSDNLIEETDRGRHRRRWMLIEGLRREGERPA